MGFNILIVMEKNCWMDAHIAHSLELMGHTVSRFYFGEYLCEFYGYKRKSEQINKNRELVNKAKSLRDSTGLDLIFCFVYDDFLLPKYAEMLSNLDVPMVNYNVDMPYQWYRQIRTAKYFDLMLCAQPDNMENLARYAKKVFYFPMAAQPFQLKYDIIQPKKTHDVTFVGTALPHRRLMLSAVSNATVPLSIYGKYWDSPEPDTCIRSMQKTLADIVHYAYPRLRGEGFGNIVTMLKDRLFSNNEKIMHACIPSNIIKGIFSETDLSLLFRSSKINIGLSRYAVDDPNQIGRCQMKLRNFEVPMAGGFYLCEQSPGYNQEFIDGREVVTWKTLPELLEKINYYLKHEDEREVIAAAGYRRAMRDHTWEARFNKLFVALGI